MKSFVLLLSILLGTISVMALNSNSGYTPIRYVPNNLEANDFFTLVNTSDIIVEVQALDKINENNSYTTYNEDGEIDEYFSVRQVYVKEVFKGEVNSDIINVFETSSKLDNGTIIVPNDYKFISMNERYLLYLTKSDTYDDYYSISAINAVVDFDKVGSKEKISPVKIMTLLNYYVEDKNELVDFILSSNHIDSSPLYFNNTDNYKIETTVNSTLAFKLHYSEENDKTTIVINGLRFEKAGKYPLIQ